MDAIKISIIIPTYNVENYVGDCLESVLEQKLDGIEIICIDDFSSDGTVEVLKRYARNYKEIKIIHNSKNQGLSYSRNRGMDVAQGKYLCFLDSDDMLGKNALKELYNVAERNRTDVIFFNCEMLIETGCSISEEEKNYCTKGNYSGIMSGQEFLEQMFCNGEMRVPVWLQFWKKESIENYNLRFLEGIYHEDILFTYIGLMRAESVFFANRVYYIYRRRKKSITVNGISDKYIISLIEIYASILNFEKKNTDIKTFALTRQYLGNIEWKLRLYLTQLDKGYYDLIEQWGLNSIYSWWLQLLVSKFIFSPPGDIELFELLKVKNVCGNIVLYGAGKVALKYILLLRKYDISIKGIAVSDINDNRKQIEGIPIYAIDKYIPYKEEITILIGVGKTFREEVIKKISEMGFKNFIVLK